MLRSELAGTHQIKNEREKVQKKILMITSGTEPQGEFPNLEIAYAAISWEELACVLHFLVVGVPCGLTLQANCTSRAVESGSNFLGSTYMNSHSREEY